MPTRTVPGDIPEYSGRRTEKKWAPIARVVDALQFVYRTQTPTNVYLQASSGLKALLAK